MDTHQLEYILAIAEENNITHAAEKLHLTQPALNQQLLRIERELGMPLFVRSRTDWHPTHAGEIYIECARKMLLLKQDAYRRLEELAQEQKSTLNIGFTPGRETRMFASIYPSMHSEFPGCIIRPQELSVLQQIDLLKKGSLDLGIIARSHDQVLDVETELLADEELLLALPQSHPLAGHDDRPIDLAQLKDEDFVLMAPGTTLRSFIDRQFTAAGFTPHILFETIYNDTVLQMVRSGICCGLVPGYYRRESPDGIRWFSMPGHPDWEVDIAWRKDGYRTKQARAFARLAAEYWKCQSVNTVKVAK